MSRTVKREPFAPICNLVSSPGARGTRVMDNNQNTPVKSEVKEEVSEYELMRMKNIQEREAMLQEITETKARVSAVFSPAAGSRERAAASRRGLLAARKEKEVLPPRKSARIAGGKIEYITSLLYSNSVRNSSHI